MANSRVCSIHDCDKPAHSRGWCRIHYYRWRRTGDPHTLKVVHGSVRRYIDELLHVAWGVECIQWPFARSPHGYGILCSKVFGTSSAPRVICQSVHGEPPTPRHQTAHSCGNGHLGCVNPRHLRWATPQENTNDKKRHGTIPKGEGHYLAKLTADDVRAIRKAAGRHSYSTLARQYGVTESAVRNAAKGKTWAHLA